MKNQSLLEENKHLNMQFLVQIFFPRPYLSSIVYAQAHVTMVKIFTRLFTNIQSRDHFVDSFVTVLEDEIDTLKNLGRELFLEIHDMLDIQERHKRAQTPRGRMFNFFGYVMSIFCVYKMLISTINVVFRRNRDKDPITDTIEKILYIWPSLCNSVSHF
jgi:hypothetical protein